MRSKQNHLRKNNLFQYVKNGWLYAAHFLLRAGGIEVITTKHDAANNKQQYRINIHSMRTVKFSSDTNEN